MQKILIIFQYKKSIQKFWEALKDYKKWLLLESSASDEMAADQIETGLEAVIDKLMNTVIL